MSVRQSELDTNIFFENLFVSDLILLICHASNFYISQNRWRQWDVITPLT